MLCAHNSKVKQAEILACNCQDYTCPLDGNFQSMKSVVYKTNVVEQNGNTETYTGLTKNTFKDRFYGHQTSFNNRKYEHETTLSTHIWKLKDAGTNYDTSWSIIEKAREFNPTTRKCTLCLKEKYHIIFQPSGATLNSRSELFSTCRHRLDKLLVNT